MGTLLPQDDHTLRRFTQEEARQKCEAMRANECRWGKDGFCTLADVKNFCSLYKEWLAKTQQ